MLENYNLNPYYDDYNDDKNFHRMLFKPSFAVQARELTQIQTILQKQIERFGNHIFKNGSVVTGGQFFFQEATYLKINNEFSSSVVNVSNFENKTILSLDNTKRAEIIRVYDNDLGTGDPKTFLVKQIFGEPFVAGETIKTSETTPYFATISTGGVGTSKVFSVNEGVFYYEGFFVRTQPQTIAISKYTSSNVFARIGFDVVESVVTTSSDTSLLDPALGSSNYQAPGADRVKIDLVLSMRTLDSTDDEKFIELVRIEKSEITREYKYPLYSVLEETLARRTYDESGNYTVRPFKISIETNAANSAQTDVILSPGKAYVYGYEYETNSPTVLTVDKPRDSRGVQNKRITADYGNFLYTKNHANTFPINSLSTIDVHCVPRESINLTSSSTITNTKIGTARVKTIEYDSAANSSNSQTYEYRTFLFDVNINQNVTGNVVGVSGSNVVIGSTESDYSSVNNSYQGAKLRIVSGPGAGEPSKTITSYDGTTKTVTLNQPFLITPTTSSVFSIDFEIKDAESLVITTGTTFVAGADIDERSKDFAKTYNDVFITDGALEPTIFVLGEQNITQNTISDMSFSYKRLYSDLVFSSNESPSLAIGVGESISSGLSLSARSENYIITVKDPGLSGYTPGQIIPADKFTIDTVTRKITVEGSSNMTANVIATINITNPTRKSKSYITANTTTIQSVGGADVFGNSAVTIYGTSGQTHIAASFVNKVPNQSQSLFVSDVKNLVSVKDFNGLAISQSNLPAAIDVTTKFIFDDGQRDSFYDHASLRLKPNVRPPVGPLVVFYNRFTSSGSGFFTVDSYSDIDYGETPIYVSPTTNNTYRLRDCLDFRPVRADATNSSGNSVVFDVDSTTTGPKIVKNGSDIILDYSFYLPRIDKVVLDKNQTFEIVEGVAELNPAVPKDKDTAMTLYILRNGAYVANTSQIQVEYVNNRRYTMRDIGSLEKRIENLEYYTSLSLLEQETISKQDLTILDTQNLSRFKNGILVDSFTGSSVADITDPDYIASIDPVRRELRPSFNISSYSLTFDAANSTNYLQSGPFVTSNATNVVLIDQPKASRFINVNPFNVVNFLGKITLNPSSDIWIDTQSKPDVLVNLTGDRDAWELLFDSINQLPPVQAEWGSWQTIWSGVPVTTTFDVQNGGRLNRATAGWETLNAGIGGANDIVRHTVQSVEQRQTRTGIISQLVPQSISQSIGERIVDVSVIPYMRSTNVLFVGTDFKPGVTVYPFFDGVSVENNVGNRVNKFYLANNNIELKKTLNDPEFVTIRDGSTVVGEAIVAHHANNIVYVTNVSPTTPFTNSNTSFTITGQTTGKTYVVTGYEHNGANAVTAGASTITLRQDAAGARNIASYNSAPIFIAQGTGAGQIRTIINYNPSTRIATVDSPWTTVPDSTSFYSIGRMKTDEYGSVVGIFTIPDGTFRVGEKLFRLVDNSSGDVGSSSTSGDASFFAQGLLQTVEETIVSATVPQIQRVTASDERVITTTTTTNRTVIWTDPLAQTFLVSPVQFPQGIFLSKVRVCFKSKDPTIPVTLQVRPAVNGYPSSSVIYPFGTVSLTPDKVKVTDSPDLDDPTKYTEFVFDAPLYMQPGEHSFVLLANSNKYEMYIAEIGKQDLVSSRQISEQPYGGSLFLSQNGSTWTADQNSDMMFRLFRYQFSANPVNAQFLVNFPDTTPTPYDLTHLITSDVSMANTVLGYQFNSETLTAGYVGYKPINPLTDYDMNDGSGTRILNPSTGEQTFILNALMQTTSGEVSPFIDISRLGFLAVNNRINNLGLSNNQIVVTNGGSGYAAPEDVSITISGGGGSGATAEAVVSEGAVQSIYIVDEGSGYTGTPTITINSITGGGAEAVAIGETSKRGGPAAARYVSRRVTLNDGFDSGDIRVYVTAYRPKESQIYVYVKLLSASDTDVFDDKEWQLLTPLGNANFVSANANDYRELIFAPGINGVADNSISYTSNGVTYNTFRTFAVKIVMAGTNTADVPKIRDLRAIALPAGE
jgi:hypothetical protein